MRYINFLLMMLFAVTCVMMISAAPSPLPAPNPKPQWVAGYAYPAYTYASYYYPTYGYAYASPYYYI